MKQINDNCIAFLAPKDASEYNIGKVCLHYNIPDANIPGGIDCRNIELPSENWEILNLVKGMNVEQKDRFLTLLGIDFSESARSIDDLFLATLTFHQIYLVNPLGEVCPDMFDEYMEKGLANAASKSLADKNRWQEAESNTGNWLILIKKSK